MSEMAIKFTNMKSVRVGRGLRARREYAGRSLEQFSREVGITESYLRRLEEGCEPEVLGKVLVKAAQVLGMRGRGRETAMVEQAVNFFLYVPSPEPQTLI